MHFPWFKRSGFLFIPINIMGWIILLAAAAYSIYSFIDIDSRSHSVSDTLINFMFRLLIIVAAYSAVGYFAGMSKK